MKDWVTVHVYERFPIYLKVSKYTQQVILEHLSDIGRFYVCHIAINVYL